MNEKIQWRKVKVKNELKRSNSSDITSCFRREYIRWKTWPQKIHAPSVHCTTVCSSQDMEAIWVSIDRGMDGKGVVHIYNGILAIRKNEIGHCSNMDGSRESHTEWSKSERDGEISYDIPHIWTLKRNDTDESESEVTQSCPTFSGPMDCSPPGSSVHGIFQARILEWVAISFSRGSSQPRDWTQVSCIAGRCFNLWATREGRQT